jgi:hypothetical protein
MEPNKVVRREYLRHAATVRIEHDTGFLAHRSATPSSFTTTTTRPCGLMRAHTIRRLAATSNDGAARHEHSNGSFVVGFPGRKALPIPLYMLDMRASYTSAI